MPMPPEPTVAERLDGLKFVSKTHRDLFTERSDRSVKLASLVTTFYLIAIAGRYGTQGGRVVDIALKEPAVVALIWVVFLTLAALTGTALWRSNHADRINQRIAMLAENSILDLVSPSTLPSAERGKHANHHYLIWYSVFVSVLAVGSAALVTYPIPQN
jgi:hypothetical protein